MLIFQNAPAMTGIRNCAESPLEAPRPNSGEQFGAGVDDCLVRFPQNRGLGGKLWAFYTVS